MACTCDHSLVLLRSNNASMMSRSSLPSTLRAHQLKLDVRIVGSQLFRRNSTLLKLGARRYSAGKLSTSRRVNLTICSAVPGEDGSAQSPLQKTGPDESAPQLMDGVFKRMRPYLKLSRLQSNQSEPWCLILWPFYWGAASAAENGTLPDLRTLTLLAAASWILLPVISTVNDLWDKDFDGKVERCKHRPLVTGEVTLFQGWVFFGAQLLLYVAILSQLEFFSLSRQFQVQVAIQLILNILYPLSKRWTHWTPVVLGLAINSEVFLRWVAVRGSGVDFGLLQGLLFFGACCWTFVYETMCAHEDIKDDEDAGVKSIALLFGDGSKLWLTGFVTAFVASLGIAGHIAAFGWPFYVSVVAAATHMGWQISSVDLKNPIDCEDKFASNIWVGAFVFGGIACAKLLA